MKQGAPISSKTGGAHNEIIKILVERRLELGWSQLELAKKLLLTTKQISRWETGESNPTLRSLTEWVQILDMCFGLTPKGLKHDR